MRSEGLQLLGLVALAIGQPLLDLVARNTGFLVAHRLTPAWIVGHLFILLLGLPLILWAIEIGVARFSDRAARGLHLSLVALLLGLMALGGMREISLSGGVVLVIAIVAGGVGSWAVARFEVVRRFTTVLAIAPIVSFAAFVSDDSVRRLLIEHYEPITMNADIDAQAPIVVVIFDAFPLSSLLNVEAEIDREMFPAFAALAGESTWFRNTATVAPWTLTAVPAILTGMLPSPRLDATVVDHPRNLFTLLGDHYEMHVDEKYTALFPGDEEPSDREDDPEAPGLPSGVSRAASFWSDLSVLYVHIVSPTDLNPLPPLDQSWKDFAGWKPADPIVQAAMGNRNPKRRFERFIEGIEARSDDGRPILHFLHILLPHDPYRYTANGRAYAPLSAPGLIWSQWPISWEDNEWWTVQAYQRHLMQLAYTDVLLGKLVAHLKRIGIYDDAVIAVIADHGNSFWPGSAQRDPMETPHPEDVISIPFFLKAPHQSESRVVERIVESVDVLATMADVLDIEIPWSLDGCSALSADCPERTGGVTVDVLNGTRLEFDRTLFEGRATLERKHRLFAEGLHRIGPHPELLGLRLGDAPVDVAVGLRGELVGRSFELVERSPENFSVARIVGHLEASTDITLPGAVAILTDGIVRAVVPVVLRNEEWIFSAMLPDDAHPAGVEEVGLVGVWTAGGETILRSIPASAP